MAIPPLNTDFVLFAAHCYSNGLRVHSRYQGVYCKRVLKMHKGKVSSFTVLWCAKYWQGGHRFVKHFPFTKEGEFEAHKAYNKYLEKYKIIPRYKVKRKWSDK